MSALSKRPYKVTQGWEREAVKAVSAAKRAAAKGEQHGGFSSPTLYDIPYDVRSAVAGLRRAADRLEALDVQYKAATAEEER